MWPLGPEVRFSAELNRESIRQGLKAARSRRGYVRAEAHTYLPSEVVPFVQGVSRPGLTLHRVSA